MAYKKRTVPTKDGKVIGLHELNQINRKEALKSQDNITQERAAAGWAWMKKGSITKQVAPANIEKNINEGFKIIVK